MVKDILLAMNSVDEQENIIRTAAKFANKHNAQLTGFYIMMDEMAVLAPYGPMPVDFVDNVIAEQKKQAAKLEKLFNKIASSEKCSATWQTVNEADDPMQTRMLYADVIFTSQPVKDHNSNFISPSFINSLILETGRPVIMIPDDYATSDIGQKPVLAWSESREAIRAVNDALPLLQQAEIVNIVTVENRYSKDNDIIRGIEISNYLTHRDVNCKFHAEYTDDKHPDEGKVLLESAHEHNADLIIMGGYGHSRIREIILGGVTRYLTINSDVPLFLSH